METTTCTLPEHQSIKRAPKPRLCTATLPVKLEHSTCLGSLYTFGDLMCSLASHVILLTFGPLTLLRSWTRACMGEHVLFFVLS